MDWLINRDTDWFIGMKITFTGLGVILLVLAVNRHFLGRVPVIHMLQVFCAGYGVLMVWELFLLNSLFPGLLDGVSTVWADSLR